MSQFSDKFKKSTKVQLLDKRTGQPIQVEESLVPRALKTGNFQFDPQSEVSVISPAGEAGTISGAEAASALTSGGFKLESAAEQQAREQKEFLDTAPQEAAATALGAARGLTFGLSDVVAAKLLGADYLKAQKEASPVASAVGEIGGVVGGLVAPVGAVGAGVKAVSKAGAAVESAIAKKLGERAASRIAAKGAGFAAEGAAYGAGQAISEAAIKDKSLTAEALVGSVGAGALIGGAFGGAFGGAGELAKVAKSVIKPVGARTGKAFKKVVDPNEAFLDVHGVTNANRARIAMERPDMAERGVELLQRGHKAGEFPVLSNTDDLVGYYDNVLESSGAKIGELSKKIDEIATLNPQIKSDMLDVAINVEKKFNDAIGAIKGDAALRRTMGRYKDDFVQEILREGENLSLKTLQDLRRGADNVVFKRSQFGQNTDKADAAREFTRIIREEIDNFAQRADSTLPIEQRGSLFKALKDANSDYHVASFWRKEAQREAAKKDKIASLSDLLFGGAIGGAADSVIQGAAAVSVKKLLESNATKNAIMLGKLATLEKQLDQKIVRSVKSFFGKAPPVREPLRAGSISAIVNSSLASDERGKPPETRRQAFSNVKTKVEQFKTNPMSAGAMAARSTNLLSRAAPEIADAAVPVAQRAAKFMADRLPADHKPQGMFQREFVPSDLELAKFERYVEGIEDPLSILSDLNDGTITREKVEAVAFVYPQLYQRIQVETLDYIEKNPEALPYQKRVQLGILLNIPSDETLAPQEVLKLQQMFAPTPPQSQQPSAAPGRPNMAKNLSSPVERASDSNAFLERRNKA